jgi:ribonuclease-3
MDAPSVITRLQERLGCSFKRPALLTQALTHKSYGNENPDRVPGNNERLEFLGDTVLGLIITEKLLLQYPYLTEGDLSKKRAKVVSEPALASVARKVGLGDFLLLGVGEEKNKGREKSSLLADALEAVIAAIYLDRGMRAAKGFVLKAFLDLVAEDTPDTLLDYKTQLQEFCQKVLASSPTYCCINELGPGHQKQFEMEVRISGVAYGSGFGKSKKAAEQQSAQVALQKLIKTDEVV